MPAKNAKSRTAPLHRIDLACRRRGVTVEAAADWLNLEPVKVQKQLEQQTDLKLGQLYDWQELLEAPLSELLIDSDDVLSDPIQAHAELGKLMETAISIKEGSRQASTQRLAIMLIEQLIDLAPELENAGLAIPGAAPGTTEEAAVAARAVPR